MPESMSQGLIKRRTLSRMRLKIQLISLFC